KHVLRDRVDVAHDDLPEREAAVEQLVERIREVDENRDDRKAQHREAEQAEPEPQRVAVQQPPDHVVLRRQRSAKRMPSNSSRKSPPRFNPGCRLTRTKPRRPTPVMMMLGSHIERAGDSSPRSESASPAVRPT